MLPWHRQLLCRSYRAERQSEASEKHELVHVIYPAHVHICFGMESCLAHELINSHQLKQMVSVQAVPASLICTAASTNVGGLQSLDHSGMCRRLRKRHA